VLDDAGGGGVSYGAVAKINPIHFGRPAKSTAMKFAPVSEGIVLARPNPGQQASANPRFLSQSPLENAL
jgi:hypothetical protein